MADPRFKKALEQRLQYRNELAEILQANYAEEDRRRKRNKTIMFICFSAMVIFSSRKIIANPDSFLNQLTSLSKSQQKMKKQMAKQFSENQGLLISGNETKKTNENQENLDQSDTAKREIASEPKKNKSPPKDKYNSDLPLRLKKTEKKDRSIAQSKAKPSYKESSAKDHPNITQKFPKQSQNKTPSKKNYQSANLSDPNKFPTREKRRNNSIGNYIRVTKVPNYLMQHAKQFPDL